MYKANCFNANISMRTYSQNLSYIYIIQFFIAVKSNHFNTLKQPEIQEWFANLGCYAPKQEELDSNSGPIKDCFEIF